MKLLLIALAFATTLFSTETIWGDDYDKAIIQAQKEKKDIYMLITSYDCRWCRKFETTTLKDEATMTRLKKEYVLLHLDKDMDDIPEIYKQKRVPRHYFLTQNGEIIHTFLGYWSAEDFSSFLNDIDKKRQTKTRIH